MRAISASTRSRSRMRFSQHGAHRARQRFPLLAARFRLRAAPGREPVAFSRSATLAVAPFGREQPHALHLMKGGIHGALLHEERVGAAALGLLEDLVSIHGALAEEGENEDADGAGEQIAVIFHRVPWPPRYE